jgi:hypothetical protein
MPDDTRGICQGNDGMGVYSLPQPSEQHRLMRTQRSIKRHLIHGHTPAKLPKLNPLAKSRC